MADVVQQGSQANQPAMMIINSEPMAHAAGDVEDPKRVFEPRVRGRWIDEVRHSQLPNVAQALKHTTVHDVALATLDADEAVNRITNVSVGGHCGRR
jgi:hypothetical protein